MAELTFAEISKLLKYDPENGKLFWLPRPAELFASRHPKRSADYSAQRWNSRLAGKEALNSVNARGYLSGSIFNRNYKAHRVAWVLATGGWPADQIDHINGNKTDNRIVNLRSVTNSDNCKNKRIIKSNTSGVCGVSWFARSRKWHARIEVNGKTVNLGYFDCLDDAARVRKQAEIDNGFHANHGGA
ncbi:HNH endonuclease [Rhizobium sp. WYCCWR 11152]|uniref:HNH endonuclease n=1 Tax=Rhizobium sp. WYCCWR 11152 TaxID=2692316 RepID=UPI001FEEE989|nr:HNH endonuclease [Rhizobium sp. WYCCWR 11152]